MKNIVFATSLLIPTLGLTNPAFSSDPVQKGLEIAKALDAQDTGFLDQVASLKMVLRDRHGRESTRDLDSRTLEVKSDGDKTLIHFTQPRSIKDTRFLSFTHKTGPDDQWLFLPKLKRVKRIASNNKSGPFVGSEFAYEDIASQEVEKYTYKYLRDEKFDGTDTYVVERYPTDKNSGYSRQVVWIAKGDGEYRALQILFYDVKGTHLKTLKMTGYKKYNEKFWRPDVMAMKNHVTGKSTDLVWSNYKFKSGLKDRDFSVNALKRTR